MSAASNYLEDALLDHVLRNTAYSQPSALYVGLFTSDPTDADSGTEIAGSSYARTSATMGAASSGTASNSADITFPAATGSWGTITHIGIYDASSAGNLLFHGAVTTQKTISSGDTFQISSGSLTISLA